MMGKFIDLTGQRFGLLVAIKRVDNKGKHIQWLCKCDCGNEKIISATNLKQGRQNSCGCTKMEDLTGKQFGKLTVIKLTDKIDSSKSHIWVCRCDCGSEKLYSSRVLKSGRAVSCGCEKNKNFKLAAAEYKKVNSFKKTSIDKIKPNKKIYKNNKSGACGVYLVGKENKYTASIGFQGRQIYLGYFNNIDDAIAARKEAEEKYFKPVLDEYAALKEGD